MIEVKIITNEQLYLAECVADYLANQEWLNSFDKFTLASLRDDFVCKKSEIGAYECCIKTAHGYCCDTCLQSELHDLWRGGVSTIGSCCGHGRKQAFIQVTSKDVQKMHELGYVRLPDDGSSDGIETFCYKPKTYLPVFADGQRREDDLYESLKRGFEEAIAYENGEIECRTETVTHDG